jgi:hypothetical protein
MEITCYFSYPIRNGPFSGSSDYTFYEISPIVDLLNLRECEPSGTQLVIMSLVREETQSYILRRFEAGTVPS